jgi:hypothetical protein
VQPELSDDDQTHRPGTIVYGIESPRKLPKKQRTKGEEHCGDNLPQIRYSSRNPTQGTFGRGVPMI